MTQILARWDRAMDAIRAEEEVAKAVLEAGPFELPLTVSRATLAGDNRRLRGIPCVARGVAGVSPNTDPLTEAMRRW